MYYKREFRIKIFNENMRLFERQEYESPSGELIPLHRHHHGRRL